MKLTADNPTLRPVEQQAIRDLCTAAQRLLELRCWNKPVTLEIFTPNGKVNSVTLVKERE
jgi:hypothetical protein